MQKQLLKSEVKQLIQERRWTDLREGLMKWPPAEVAELLLDMDQADSVLLFRSLPRQFAAEVFAELEPHQQDGLLKNLTAQETSQLLADLTPDDRTALFEELPAQVTRRLLDLLSPADLKEARQLLGYPEESVGRLMTPDYVSVHPDWTVARALDHIRLRGKDSETINVIYVTDRSGKLLDDIRLRTLILAQPNDTIEQLMDHNVASLSAFEDREKAVQMIRRYDLVALPVVDSEGILLGIVTIDDLMDVEEAEVTEDFHRIAAVSVQRGEDGFIESIRNAPMNLLYRRRVAWLLLLVFFNIFSGAAIATFEETIVQAFALVFFLPLLVASGGNAGAQAATLMVRALATGDVRMNDWARLLGRELVVATALGVTMGVAVSFIGIFRGGSEIALVVALAMIAIVIVGSTVGMSLPFLFSKMGRDPATASAPLITSIADVFGIFIYFSIAAWFLNL